ncbi:hypothetical protein Gotur_026209 [Gossypium turneri]
MRRPTIPSQLSRFPALHLLENTVLNNTMSSFSSFAHSNRRTLILRHMATELNLNMRSDGHVKVEDLLKLNMRAFANIPLRSQTVDDNKEHVTFVLKIDENGFFKNYLLFTNKRSLSCYQLSEKDNKQRFSLLEENGELLICANQGHTVMVMNLS